MQDESATLVLASRGRHVFPHQAIGGFDYLQLVESHRVDGKPRQSVVATLGRLDAPRAHRPVINTNAGCDVPVVECSANPAPVAGLSVPRPSGGLIMIQSPLRA